MAKQEKNVENDLKEAVKTNADPRRRRRMGLLGLALLGSALGIGYRLQQQFQRNEALVAAVRNNDAAAALTTLYLGADPNAYQVDQILPATPNEWIQWVVGTRHISRHSFPIITVAATNGNVLIVDALITQGANIEATDPLGFTPLMTAAGAGKCEVVRLLLSRRAAINARTPSGSTALALARINHRQEAIQILQQQGARE